MYELLENLNDIITNNFSEDYNKIENIIKSNKIFISLDIDEKELLLDDLRDKYNEITEKKKNLDDIKPSYKDIKDYKKKSNYMFGHQEKEQVLIMTDDNKLLTEGEIMSDNTYAKFIKLPSTDDLIRRTKIFEDTKIKSLNMPLQKSKEWHELRKNRIGGSECGTVLNMNKYQAQYNFILDKVLGSEFKGNEQTYHGNVFEDTVRMIYEYNNDVHTEEFSSMPHPTIPILAASPDGIVSPYCRDKKTLTKLVGRMLEIKCPSLRKIKYSGDIKDTICPIYYWCQIQQQLECLDLDECDFIQCNIERYDSRNEWLADMHPECEFKSAKYNNFRGIIIELIPIKLNESDYNNIPGQYSENTRWEKTKCIYPPRVDMSNKELDDWVLTELSKTHFGYTLHKIIYWRLKEQNCTLILRDKEWFYSQLETYNKIWDYVVYLRKNLDVIYELKDWINTQPRKYNDKILFKLNELIEKKEKSNIINNTEIIMENQIQSSINIDSDNSNIELNECKKINNENKIDVKIDDTSNKTKRKYCKKIK